jgi:mRNA-degrading endonuclease RelE of RelBE toxin-antitoxin system
VSDADSVLWRVELGSPAVRSLDRLPEKVAAAVVEFVTGTLPTDPYRMSKPLQAPLEGWRVARRGDYRVTLQIIDDDGVVLIGRIDHRADIYRT